MHPFAQRLKKLILEDCFGVLSVLLLTTCLMSAQEASRNTQTAIHPEARETQRLSPKLSPLPAGVEELKFSDFFKFPVGAQGLEMTAKLKQLDGHTVRILGYMVHQTEPWTNAFLLAPVPVQLHEHEYGQADDLPPSTLYVRMSSQDDGKVPYTHGLMLITGTLHIGAREIEDERRTWVSLDMEMPAAAQTPSLTTVSSPASSHTMPDAVPAKTENTKQMYSGEKR